ncbi:septum site determining protein [Corynebacterium sp. zg-331]|uniref:septum site-determining protein Ssd n=1 Tax=unclassified Corynebacterium TaxID=2624378 RepID=UPI00128E5B6D|nr:MULTISPECIES: septum site-determining protein Ssd [unclassified Corynebacterium]MBC3186563.1 septum site determining protein [Corynebacterium sp. zg-331]MPV53047.1 septum site determining protein [Corynebacterium sp. zg331]
MNLSAFLVILIVMHPALRSEALQIAAASGMKVIETTEAAEITRHYPRASAVLIDAEARHLLPPPPPRGVPAVYLLVPDPGPIPHPTVVSCRADRGFVIPAQATDLLQALGRSARESASPAPHRGRVLGVLGVLGGAGASTLAVVVARCAARGGQAVLIDAVDRSGGLDLLVGCEETPGARWPDLHVAEGRLAAEELVAALPVRESLAVLSASRSTVDDGYRLSEGELRGAVDTLRRGEVPVVVDLPGVGELSLAGAQACDEVVLVCPAEVRAGARLAGLAAHLRACGVAVSVVARHRGWSGLEAADMQHLSQATVVAQVPTIGGLAKATELGGVPARAPRALRAAAKAVWR